MNIRLSYDIKFSAIIIDGVKITPNKYKIIVDLITTTDDATHQNIAFQRILFLVNELFHNSIFISDDNINLGNLTKLANKNHFVILPDAPYDQIIGHVLFHKIAAITSEKFEVDTITISSEASDNLKYIIEDFSSLSDLENPWWDRDDLTTVDIPDITLNMTWNDINLDWNSDLDSLLDVDLQESENLTEVIFTPERKVPNIFIIDGGKSKDDSKDEND